MNTLVSRFRPQRPFPPAIPSPPRAGKVHWLWLVGLAALGLLAAGPTLVGLSPLRHDLPRTRMRGFQNRIEVASASLGWFSPAVLRGVKFFDNDGEPFLEMAETRDERTLLQQLLHPSAGPRLSTRDTLVSVKLRPEGSNLEEALRPVREFVGKRPPQPQTMHSTNATLRIVDVASGDTIEWRDADLQITRPSDPALPHSLKLTARPAQGPAEARLAVNLTWNDLPNGTLRDIDFDVEGTALPLANLRLLARRLAGERPLPAFELAGNSTVALKGKLPQGLGQPPVGDLAGSLTLHQLDFGCPQLLGSDRLTSDQTTLKFDLGSTGKQATIRSLALTSETTTLNGAGTVALEEHPGTVVEPVTLQGRVDLGQLAKMLPQTVKLPDETRLDSGELTLELRGTPGATPDAGTRWTLAAGTPRIEATLGSGERVEWTSPVDIQLALHQTAETWRCDTLKIQTPLLTLQGEPTEHGLHLGGEADLASLIEQLHLPVDRETTTVSGTIALTGDVGWPTDGHLPMSTQVVLRDVELRRLVTRVEERAVPQPAAAGPTGETPPPPLPDGAAGEGDAAEGGTRPPAPGLDAPTPPAESGPPQPAVEEEPASRPGAPRPGLAPRSTLPVPLLGGVSDRRTQRAANRADRAGRREARREALAEQRAERAAAAATRAAERDSIVYEQVAVSEWKTLFRDPQVVLKSQVDLAFQDKILRISRAELTASGLSSVSQGEVTELLAGNVVHLRGELSTTLAELAQALTRESAIPLEMEGQQQFRFQVDGPLAQPQVQLTGGWERVAAAGLIAGPAQFTAGFQDRILTLQPTAFALSGGEMHVGGRLDMSQSPPVLEIPAGPVCTNVALTQSICNGWMQYIAPMVSQAARAEGIFSLSLDDTRFAPQDLPHAQLSGRLEIPVGRVLPGPIFEQLGQLITPIEAAARRGGLMGDLLSTEKPLAVLQDQVIDFELHDGRIHHTPALVELRKIAISTSGSVGLDQTLDITAVLLFPTEWVRRLPFLAGPGGQGLVIPVGGTLKKPRIEPGTVRRIFKELGTGALGDLLNGVLPGSLPLPRLPGR